MANTNGALDAYATGMIPGPCRRWATATYWNQKRVASGFGTIGMAFVAQASETNRNGLNLTDTQRLTGVGLEIAGRRALN